GDGRPRAVQLAGGSLLTGASGGRQVRGRHGGARGRRAGPAWALGRVVASMLAIVPGGCDGNINGPDGSGPSAGSPGGSQNGGGNGAGGGSLTDGGVLLSADLPC